MIKALQKNISNSKTRTSPIERDLNKMKLWHQQQKFGMRRYIWNQSKQIGTDLINKRPISVLSHHFVDLLSATFKRILCIKRQTHSHTCGFAFVQYYTMVRSIATQVRFVQVLCNTQYTLTNKQRMKKLQEVYIVFSSCLVAVAETDTLKPTRRD